MNTSASTPTTATPTSSLRYASAADPNTVAEYELTFVDLLPASDGQKHTTVTWASSLESANAEIAERMLKCQALTAVRAVYSHAAAFTAFDTDLMKR